MEEPALVRSSRYSEPSLPIARVPALGTGSQVRLLPGRRWREERPAQMRAYPLLFLMVFWECASCAAVPRVSHRGRR